jgi:hypothetical protein
MEGLLCRFVVTETVNAAESERASPAVASTDASLGVVSRDHVCLCETAFA